jgi:hypothetical protein
MTNEEIFIRTVELVESDDDDQAWGDSDRAVGPFQDHPSYYATWGPVPSEFGGIERDWDWAFRFAIVKFYRFARRVYPEKTDLQIAMARHLHGQQRWDGNDTAYAVRYIAKLAIVMKQGD